MIVLKAVITSVIITLCIFPCTTGVASTDIFVTPLRSNDRNTGTRTRPLRTIGAAQQCVRAMIARGMTADVTVVLQGGTYYLANKLVFDDRDSGRNGHRVIYRAFPGETVSIVGGRRISGWRRVDEHVYSADVREVPAFSVMFEDDQWCIPARTPNKGYFHADAGTKAGDKPELVCNAADFPGRFDHRNACVWVWVGRHSFGVNYDWIISTLPMDSVDYANRKITLGNKTAYDLSPENRYFLSGAREFLDQPGEFYLDRAKNVVYYWPRKTPIDRQDIVASVTCGVIDFIGRSEATPVRNISFEGLNLSVSDPFEHNGPEAGVRSDSMIYLSNAENITINNCRLRNAGASAIEGYGWNKGHRITGCLIENIGHHGITLSGYKTGGGPFKDENKAYVSKNCVISNNCFRRCGRRIGHGNGILLSQSGDNEISHNLFEDMPRYGILMVGYSYSHIILDPKYGGFNGRLYGKQVTWNNRLDFLYSRNNRIVDNEFRMLMTDSADGGAICTWAVGAGNVIARNLVHHLKAFSSDVALVGIYLDDATPYATVKDNIVSYMSGSDAVYPYMIKGIGNVVTNNIAANNQSNAAFYVAEAGLANLPDSPPGIRDERVGGLTFTRNIVYGDSGRVIYKLYPWRDDLIAVSDHNLYSVPTGTCQVIMDWVNYPWDEWQRRARGTYDKHSVFADPLFVNPAVMDYRLKPDSPARKLGFRDIDRSRIGLKQGFPFADAVIQADDGSLSQP